NVILPADVNAFIDQVVSGVGLDAAQLPPGYARLFQGGSHGGEEAGFLDAIRAIDNQRIVGILGGLFADLFFHAAAEENFGGAVKFIICHSKSLLIEDGTELKLNSVPSRYSVAWFFAKRLRNSRDTRPRSPG